MKKSIMAAILGVAVIGGGTAATLTIGNAGAAGAQAREVVVYKSPLCGCCGGWVDYMRDHGYRVTVHDTDDMDTIKQRLGVPEEAWSCHTAQVDGYVVEGHVPIEAIDKLFAERPKVAGIASPGMPQGSPGMSGPKEANVVVTFGDGKTAVFGRY